MEPGQSRYERGLDTMRAIFGPGIESALKGLAATSADLARCLVELPFADIDRRPGLDLKTREMLTLRRNPPAA
jgi:4-carboxymuconolactone decarboxylase